MSVKPAARLRRKDLVGIDPLSPGEIQLILDTADQMRDIAARPIKKVPALRGKTVVNLFMEASTRTRFSFEVAEKRLSADSLSFSASASSVSKGETLVDTALNLEAMQPDFIVIRHVHAGAPHQLARILKSSVINAGDGAHEHPTQALLDALTMRLHRGTLEGLVVAIVGDLQHSRVVRSNVLLLSRMGATVRVAAPPSLIPLGMEKLGCEVHRRIEDAIAGADVVDDAADPARAAGADELPDGARVLRLLRPHPGAAEAREEGLPGDAPGPDEPRGGDRLPGRGRAAVGDPGAGDQRGGGAHGGAVPAGWRTR